MASFCIKRTPAIESHSEKPSIRCSAIGSMMPPPTYGSPISGISEVGRAPALAAAVDVPVEVAEPRFPPSAASVSREDSSRRAGSPCGGGAEGTEPAAEALEEVPESGEIEEEDEAAGEAADVDEPRFVL